MSFTIRVVNNILIFSPTNGCYDCNFRCEEKTIHTYEDEDKESDFYSKYWCGIGGRSVVVPDGVTNEPPSNCPLRKKIYIVCWPDIESVEIKNLLKTP